MESFGSLIKKLRSRKGLLLREVAAEIEIDPSLLSRIECNYKRATREQVTRLASILDGNENEMLITYLSDKIVYELRGEKLAADVMSVAEQKIRYLSKHQENESTAQ